MTYERMGNRQPWLPEIKVFFIKQNPKQLQNS